MSRRSEWPSSYEGTKRTHPMEALSLADLAFFRRPCARTLDRSFGELRRPPVRRGALRRGLGRNRRRSDSADIDPPVRVEAAFVVFENTLQRGEPHSHAHPDLGRVANLDVADHAVPIDDEGGRVGVYTKTTSKHSLLVDDHAL